MSTERYTASQPSAARAIASAITGRMPRSQTSCMRCQRRSCSRIQAKTSGGGQYPRRPTCTKLRPRTAPDSSSRRIGVPCDARLPSIASAVSACASKCTRPRRPQPWWRATAVADGHVIEWSPPITTGTAPAASDGRDLGLDVGVRALGLAVRAPRVAGVDDVEPLPQLHTQVEVVRARVVRGRPQRPRAEARARAGTSSTGRTAHRRSPRQGGAPPAPRRPVPSRGR